MTKINKHIMTLNQMKSKIMKSQEEIVQHASMKMYYDEIQKHAKSRCFSIKKRQVLRQEMNTIKKLIEKQQITIDAESDNVKIVTDVLKKPFETASDMWKHVNTHSINYPICFSDSEISNFYYFICGHFFL